ncbi:MAG TPA: hypothetical protein VGG54_06290 [Trebonia sp.]
MRAAADGWGLVIAFTAGFLRSPISAWPRATAAAGPLDEPPPSRPGAAGFGAAP